jgi:hypothetical protein
MAAFYTKALCKLVLASLFVTNVTLAHEPKQFADSERTDHWLNNAKQRNGSSCCGTSDAYREGETYDFMGKKQIVLEDWAMKGDEYWVKIAGAWMDVGKEGAANIVHNNPLGIAVVWITDGRNMYPMSGTEFRILCFSPGTQI